MEPEEACNVHVGGSSLPVPTTVRVAQQGIHQTLLTFKPSSLGVTHLSLCIHISIRIGHRQQENIHFLQDGGDGWVLPVIRCDLSRDKKLVSFLGDQLGCPVEARVSSPGAPCSLSVPLIDTALCKALGALQTLGEHGFLMTSTAESGAAWLVPSFQGVGTREGRATHHHSFGEPGPPH